MQTYLLLLRYSLLCFTDFMLFLQIEGKNLKPQKERDSLYGWSGTQPALSPGWACVLSLCKYYTVLVTVSYQIQGPAQITPPC